LTHRLIHRAVVATAMIVALAVAAAPATANGGHPLIVPTSSAEHANPDFMVVPTSSSERIAPGSSSDLIVPVTSTEHRVSTTADVAQAGPATQSTVRWEVLAPVGLLLLVLGAAVTVIGLRIRTRDVAV